ncbi:helix-hairpin-helix domain-containing protein, partial [Streptomyces sp. GC420]|uniref:helix-hairpin-helix domain-containing protein n=1 Tax=Streptomyces sp. GC420 TaxID=2697568 RepID=UPI0014152A92
GTEACGGSPAGRDRGARPDTPRGAARPAAARHAAGPGGGGPAPAVAGPRAPGAAVDGGSPGLTGSGTGTSGATGAAAGLGGLAPEAVGGVREVLAEGRAPEALSVRVVEVLGASATQLLRQDPWQLLAVPGVSPEHADGFARALLGDACGPADERRTSALVRWVLERAAGTGHTALTADTVRAGIAKRSVPDPEKALWSAIEDGSVLVFQDGLTESGTGETGAETEVEVEVLVGLDRYALAEESLADGLARLVNTFVADQPDGTGWEPDSELVRAVAGNGLVAHSGGEAARAEAASVVTAARARGLRAFAAAHSENGRKRLAADLPGQPDAALTVAGLLSGAEGPGRDVEGLLALDVLVVLDAPQLDVESAAVLVESVPDGARLVLSGDPGVLGSAGAGRVFADVLASGACPRVNSRVPDPGPLGELVSGIGIGELNQVEAPGRELVIVPVRDAGEAVHRTVQLVADSVPRALGIPAEQTQVITPGHGGAAGTRVLNTALKERFNPGPGRFGGFDPGDRIAWVPAPGRTLRGTVVGADAEGLRLECEGVPVHVARGLVERTVRHAWALTAHQAVGIRWPAVVVVLPGDAAQALSRPWVYTAFGRGERHLSVVQGVEQALPRAVAEVPAQERTTRLRTLLRTQPKPAD